MGGGRSGVGVACLTAIPVPFFSTALLVPGIPAAGTDLCTGCHLLPPWALWLLSGTRGHGTGS